MHLIALKYDMEHLQPHTMCISKMVRVFDKCLLSLPNNIPNLQGSLILWNWWQTGFAGLCSLRETKQNQSFQSRNAQLVASVLNIKREGSVSHSQCVADTLLCAVFCILKDGVIGNGALPTKPSHKGKSKFPFLLQVKCLH